MGAFVSKAQALAAIEYVAAAEGESLVTPAGDRRLGGHSLRASIAQHLAGAGLDFLTLQVLARWGSDIIPRCVAGAPILTLTDQCKKAIANADLEASLARLAKGVESSRLLRAVFPHRTRHPLGGDVVLAVRPGETPPHAAPPAGPGVSEGSEPLPPLAANPKSGAVHRGPQSGHLLEPRHWRTWCGWFYGGVYSSSHNIPFVARLVCGPCFPTVKPTVSEGVEHQGES